MGSDLLFLSKQWKRGHEKPGGTARHGNPPGCVILARCRLTRALGRGGRPFGKALRRGTKAALWLAGALLIPPSESAPRFLDGGEPLPGSNAQQDSAARAFPLFRFGILPLACGTDKGAARWTPFQPP